MPLSDLAESTRRAKDRAADKQRLRDTELATGETLGQCAKRLKRDRLLAQHLRGTGAQFLEVAAVMQESEGGGASLVSPMRIRPRLRVVRRTNASHAAAEVGVGSVVRVRWPPQAGQTRGKFWEGTVASVVPASEGVYEHVIEYTKQPGRLYRHDLAAGDTKYTVATLELARPDASCQQGKPACNCSAHEHRHTHA